MKYIIISIILSAIFFILTKPVFSALYKKVKNGLITRELARTSAFCFFLLVFLIGMLVNSFTHSQYIHIKIYRIMFFFLPLLFAFIYYFFITKGGTIKKNQTFDKVHYINTSETKKRTVNISKKLIASIFLGFLLAFIVTIFGHLSPKDWRALPITSSVNDSHIIPVNTPVGMCGYECMFGQRHHADCSGKFVYNFASTNLSIEEIFSASFEHWGLILIIGVITSSLIYLFKRVSFKIV